MKKVAAVIAAALVCSLALTGCGMLHRVVSGLRERLGRTAAPTETAIPVYTPYPTDTPYPEPAEEETESPADTAEAGTAAPEETAAATEAPQPQSTDSGLSGDREDISSEELIAFLRQVAFGGEDTAYKWEDPIVVAVSGKYSQADSDQLTNIFDMLNEYDGFPGITYIEAAGKDAEANMDVRFLSTDEMEAEEPDWDGSYPCYATFHDSDCAITKSTVYLVTDMVTDQAERNYLLTWGVFYTLGFYNDSDMYRDSIFNPEFIDEQLGSSFASPVAADWYMVSMLYSEAVRPGMTADEAVDALAD